METKELIRKRALQMRDGMDSGERREKSLLIARRVMEEEAYREAACLLCYASYRSEVETRALMEHAWAAGKRVYCPKVCGKEMEFYRIWGPEDLQEGYRGIWEPQAQESVRFCSGREEISRCLMIMPGSAFDKERNRIGYGGGYYDRYLEKYEGLTVIAVCFEIQMQEKLPSDSHDRKPDRILTECNAYSGSQ